MGICKGVTLKEKKNTKLVPHPCTGKYIEVWCLEENQG